MAVLGFLTAWNSQGGWTSYVGGRLPQSECSKRPDGRYYLLIT